MMKLVEIFGACFSFAHVSFPFNKLRVSGISKFLRTSAEWGKGLKKDLLNFFQKLEIRLFVIASARPEAAIGTIASRRIRALTGYALATLLLSAPLASLELTVEFPGLEETTDDQGSRVPVVYAGRDFLLRITAKSATRLVGEPVIEGIENFQVTSRSTACNVALVGNEVIAENVYDLRIMADKPGVVKVGPVSLRDGSQQCKTGAFYCKVMPSQDAPAANPGRQQGGRKDVGGVACDLVTDKTEVFVGEPIQLSIIFYQWGHVLETAVGEHDLGDFTVKPLKDLAHRAQRYKGHDCMVTEKRFILYPKKAGATKISPVEAQYLVPVQGQSHRHGGFYGMLNNFLGPQVERRSISSNPVLLSIKPLPKKQRSVDAIGSFDSFQATVDRNKAAVNEPINLRLIITGRANFDMIPEPRLQLPTEWKSYKSRSYVEEDFDKAVYAGGKKIFEFIVQIPRGGQHTIPAQQFSYFDTATGTNQTLTTEPIQIVVEGSSQVQVPVSKSTVVQPVQPQADAQDIHHIDESADLSSAWRSVPWWLFILLLLLPLLLFVRDFRHAALPWLLRRQQAKNKSPETFSKELEQLAQAGSGDALRGFFARVLSVLCCVEPHDVTEELIERALRARGWTPEKIQELFDYLNECASLAFVRASRNEQLVERLFKKASYWLLLLQKN